MPSSPAVASPAAPPSTALPAVGPAAVLGLGDRIFAKDAQGGWCVARMVDVIGVADERRASVTAENDLLMRGLKAKAKDKPDCAPAILGDWVRVHFKGWNKNHDEWMRFCERGPVCTAGEDESNVCICEVHHTFTPPYEKKRAMQPVVVPAAVPVKRPVGRPRLKPLVPPPQAVAAAVASAAPPATTTATTTTTTTTPAINPIVPSPVENQSIPVVSNPGTLSSVATSVDVAPVVVPAAHTADAAQKPSEPTPSVVAAKKKRGRGPANRESEQPSVVADSGVEKKPKVEELQPVANVAPPLVVAPVTSTPEPVKTFASQGVPETPSSLPVPSVSFLPPVSPLLPPPSADSAAADAAPASILPSLSQSQPPAIGAVALPDVPLAPPPHVALAEPRPVDQVASQSSTVPSANKPNKRAIVAENDDGQSSDVDFPDDEPVDDENDLDGVASSGGAANFLSTSSFSPLLDGDGVASLTRFRRFRRRRLFQSPSRWGRCCIQRANGD